jgi:hypothetical protein
MMLRFSLALLATIAAPAALHAQEVKPVVDLSEYDDFLAVAPTRMLVLGTAHLSGFRDFIDRPGLDKALQPLLARLEAFAPDTIAVEDVSGPDCAIVAI